MQRKRTNIEKFEYASNIVNIENGMIILCGMLLLNILVFLQAIIDAHQSHRNTGQYDIDKSLWAPNALVHLSRFTCVFCSISRFFSAIGNDNSFSLEPLSILNFGSILMHFNLNDLFILSFYKSEPWSTELDESGR